MGWGEAYLDHYTRYLGDPRGREVFRRNPQESSIQILWYDKVFPGARVFCSLGLSHFADAIGRPAEVCLASDGCLDECPTVLANVLFYLVGHQMQIGRGIVIGGIESIAPEFSRVSGKTAAYITQTFGFPEGFGEIEGAAGRGRIYWAFPIAEEEREFVRHSGADAFEDALERQGADPLSIGRDSIF